MNLAGYVDLSARTLLRLRGEDRVRYLNGQVTQDVRKANAQSALYAAVTNAKGKLEADVFISAAPEGDALWIDGPAELRETLPVRLERYIISDDAELEDVSGQFQLIHVLGEEPRTEAWKRQANRYGVPGWDLIGPAVVHELSAIPEEALTECRIRHGIAAWGAELGPDILPQEARLEDRAVDFHKGCYIGQEVISRIKSVGRVNRRLEAFASVEPATELETGMEVRLGDAALGVLTSVAWSAELNAWIGMGIVKSRDLESGDESALRVGGIRVKRLGSSI